MLYLACFVQMVNVVQSTGNSGQQIHNEANASFLEVAAPVPNPEAETHVEYRPQARGLGRGRSEGWESRQTPGNGVNADTRESTLPVKIGNAGRETGTPFSRIRKRAYKRALNRASRGPTTYRGQQVTLQDLQGQYVGRGDVQAQRRTAVRQQAQRPSAATLTVSCLTWNCGGLSNLGDEFFTWLDSQSYDVIFLQETWHTQSMEYTTRGWHCISSGIGCDPKRAHAGVMTLLRATVFKQDFIRRHEHVPGRLLQVRAFCQGGWIDTLNIYQHALGLQIHEVDILQKRSQLWQQVRTILGQIPQGHKLVVAGDMNCNLDHVPACTGTGMLTPSAVSPDRDDLVAILVDFRLRAVNAYGRRGGCTYMTDTSRHENPSLIISWFGKRAWGSIKRASSGTGRSQDGGKEEDICRPGRPSAYKDTGSASTPHHVNGLTGSAKYWRKLSRNSRILHRNTSRELPWSCREQETMSRNSSTISCYRSGKIFST